MSSETRRPDADADGVRTIRKQSQDGGSKPRSSLPFVLAASALVLGAAVFLFGRSSREPEVAVGAPAGGPAVRSGSTARPRLEARRVITLGGRTAGDAPPSAEGRAEPARAGGRAENATRDLIESLRATGETGGIAAFNPPGTVPIKIGIVVPDDFELPEGYVRYHQVTDRGQRVEPILMFSPDYEFVDRDGQPIALPEDGVVPAEMAPPGLPLRMLKLPRESRGADDESSAPRP